MTTLTTMQKHYSVKRFSLHLAPPHTDGQDSVQSSRITLIPTVKMCNIMIKSTHAIKFKAQNPFKYNTLRKTPSNTICFTPY